MSASLINYSTTALAVTERRDPWILDPSSCMGALNPRPDNFLRGRQRQVDGRDQAWPHTRTLQGPLRDCQGYGPMFLIYANTNININAYVYVCNHIYTYLCVYICLYAYVYRETEHYLLQTYMEMK